MRDIQLSIDVHSLEIWGIYYLLFIIISIIVKIAFIKTSKMIFSLYLVMIVFLTFLFNPIDFWKIRISRTLLEAEKIYVNMNKKGNIENIVNQCRLDNCIFSEINGTCIQKNCPPRIYTNSTIKYLYIEEEGEHVTVWGSSKEGLTGRYIVRIQDIQFTCVLYERKDSIFKWQCIDNY